MTDQNLQIGPEDQSPISIDHEAGGYRCAQCWQELPEGCLVHCENASDGAVIGVRAETNPDGVVVHSCGTLAQK